MNILALQYKTITKQLTLDNSSSPIQLARLLQTVFNTSQDILGITDSFGKFYDLQYASNHLTTLHNHKFTIVTTRDTANNVSFGRNRSISDPTLTQPTKCIGRIIDILTFRKNLPLGIIAIVTLTQGDKINSIPFEHYLVYGECKWFQVWRNGYLLIQCQVGNQWQKFLLAASRYLSQQINSNTNTTTPVADLSFKQAMIVEALDELLQDGIISDKDYAKRKSLLYQKPYIEVRRYFTGETIDRCELVNVIRTEIVNARQHQPQFRVDRLQIPISNKSSAEKKHLQRTTHLLDNMQKQKLISPSQKQFSINTLYRNQKHLLRITQQYWKGEIDTTELACYLHKLVNQQRGLVKITQDHWKSHTDQTFLPSKLKKAFNSTQSRSR